MMQENITGLFGQSLPVRKEFPNKLVNLSTKAFSKAESVALQV
jgi:hypothetical protein